MDTNSHYERSLQFWLWKTLFIDSFLPFDGQNLGFLKAYPESDIFDIIGCRFKRDDGHECLNCIYEQFQESKTRLH